MRRKEDAEKDVVPWQTPEDVYQHVKAQRGAAIQKRMELLGKLPQYQGDTESQTRKIQSQYLNPFHVGEYKMLEMMGQAVAGEEADALGKSAEATEKVEAKAEAEKEQVAEEFEAKVEAEAEAEADKEQAKSNENETKS